MRLRRAFNISMSCTAVCSHSISESALRSLSLTVNPLSKPEFTALKAALWAALGAPLGATLGALFGIDRLYTLLLEPLTVERLPADVSVEVFVEALELDSGSEWDSELNSLEAEERMIGMLSTPLSLTTAEPVMALRSFTCSVNSTETTTRRGRRSFEAACMHASRDRA